MNDVTLSLYDPVIFAKCPKCTASYPGKNVGDYFAKAYPRRRLGRTAQEVVSAQRCDNCGTDMQFMYEVK